MPAKKVISLKDHAKIAAKVHEIGESLSELSSLLSKAGAPAWFIDKALRMKSSPLSILKSELENEMFRNHRRESPGFGLIYYRKEDLSSFEAQVAQGAYD